MKTRELKINYRKIMENTIGCKLTRDEIVHHRIELLKLNKCLKLENL